jgi:hypothetical protein
MSSHALLSVHSDDVRTGQQQHASRHHIIGLKRLFASKVVPRSLVRRRSQDGGEHEPLVNVQQERVSSKASWFERAAVGDVPRLFD